MSCLEPLLPAAPRAARSAPTPARRLLWWRLRGGSLGCRFRRQHPVGSYLVDFACWPARLAVVIRGHSPAADQRRERYLAGQGWRVLALTEAEVLRQFPAAIDRIASAVRAEG